MGRIINQAVMGFWDTAKRKAQQTALQGQVLLVDRQTTALQHQLGVDIFSLVFGFAQAQEQHSESQDGDDASDSHGNHHASSSSSHSSLLDSCRHIEGLQAMFVAAYEDVQELVQRRLVADTARDRLEAQQEAGKVSWMNAAAARAKYTAEMAYLDREMLLRQQIFGYQVATECSLAERDLEDRNATPPTTRKNELVQLLYKFQADAQALQQQRKDLVDEIALLSGNRPTENRSLVIPDDSAADGTLMAADPSNNSESMTDEDL